MRLSNSRYSRAAITLGVSFRSKLAGNEFTVWWEYVAQIPLPSMWGSQEILPELPMALAVYLKPTTCTELFNLYECAKRCERFSKEIQQEVLEWMRESSY